MLGTLSTSLGLTSVITDVKARKAEVLDIDQVFIVGELYDALQRVAQITLAFGAKASTGRIEPIRAQRLEPITIKDDEFTAIFVDAVTGLLRPRDANFMNDLMVSLILPRYTKLVFGGTAFQDKDGKPIAETITVAGKQFKNEAQLQLEQSAKNETPETVGSGVKPEV
jgi:hypothetical protein